MDGNYVLTVSHHVIEHPRYMSLGGNDMDVEAYT